MQTTRQPLILTLAIENTSRLFFDALRRKHFPSSINFIDAHLTLFHALPYEETTIKTVKEACERQSLFLLNITEPVSIGRGVAFKIESAELSRMHKDLQQRWHDILKAQDRQKLWPHITIQNKVSAQKSRNLLEELKEQFLPFKAAAIGLQLWEYLNGPWQPVAKFAFKETAV